jgi:hypothetical protein
VIDGVRVGSYADLREAKEAVLKSGALKDEARARSPIVNILVAFQLRPRRRFLCH